MNRRHNRFVVAAAVVTTAAVLVSPAGAATTAWTSQHLTKAVKSLVGYRNLDSRRDSRQGWKIKAVAHTNFLQTGKLHRLAAFRTSATGRLSGLEAQNVIQAQLNGGILDTEKTVELPAGSPGAPHGGWMMFTRNGDCYILYNGSPGAKGGDGAKGDQGAKGDAGENGAPGLSAYQVWLAEGNTGTVDDFMQAIAGPKGDPGAPGKDGKDGVNGAVGAPGLSAYEEWLGVGNTGTIADFLHSIVGPQGPKGDKGATGATGAPGQSAYQAWLALGNCGSVADFVHSLIGPQGPKGDKGATGATGPQGPPISTQLTTVCVVEKGNSTRLGIGAECNGHTALQVYVPAS